MRNDDELRIVTPLDIDTIGSLGQTPSPQLVGIYP